jgi:hypothetical protein
MKRPPRAYSVVMGEKDPDLSSGPLLDAIRLADWSVTGKLDIVSLQWNPKPADKSLLQVTIWCDACKSRGTKLAEIWSTKWGPLFRAALVYSHRDLPAPRPVDPVLIVHPTLPGQVAETSRRAFEKVNSKRGWVEAPEDSKPPEKWKPNRSVLIRDLLDFLPDEEHPPLMVKCRRGHGETEVDRARLMSLFQPAAARAQQIQLSSVRMP